MGRIVVRRAVRADLADITGFAERLHETHELRFDFCAEDFAAWFGAMLDNPAFIAFRSDGGFICGIVVPAPQNWRWRQVFQAYWWAGDHSGNALRQVFEDEAARMGAKEIKFSHPVTAEPVGKMLKRRGHTPAEIVYTKGV